MILYKYSFNVFVADYFVGIASVNSFDHSHATNSIRDFLSHKYAYHWELENNPYFLKTFNTKIESHENVPLTHDNIITIDYSVKFESNKEY